MELSRKSQEILSIQIRIMVMLSEICGLTQEEVTEILSNTNLLSIIEKAYFMLHQEGDYANMIHIKEALSARGYDIEVPPISHPKWKEWNGLS